MPRNISFALTTPQFRTRTKFVTRRLGWQMLKPGDVLMGCRKCQGLKPGEQIERLGQIRVEHARREKLQAMTENLSYGFAECILEGFGDHAELRWPSAFVDFFCRSHKGCTPATEITRIEFDYVGAPGLSRAIGRAWEAVAIIEGRQ